MIGTGLLGLALLGLFLISGLWMEHIRERPVYERPPVLIHPIFRTLWSPTRWVAFFLGWILLARTWPRLGAILALFLAAMWGWKRYLRSRHHWDRTIRSSFLLEKARNPQASDIEILTAILLTVRGHWGQELIDQIVADHPTPEGIAAMIVRMERSLLPRGFDPTRTSRGGSQAGPKLK